MVTNHLLTGMILQGSNWSLLNLKKTAQVVKMRGPASDQANRPQKIAQFRVCVLEREMGTPDFFQGNF